MKTFGIILLASAGLLDVRAAEDTASAGTTNSVVISTEYIDRLVAEARTNNPAQLAADSRADAAAANVESIRSWDDPMFTIGGNVFGRQGFDARQEGDLVYGLQEKLPLWGIPRLNRRVAAAERSVRQAQGDARFQQLRRDIAKTLIAAALARQVVDIGEQDLAWLGATSKAVESKYRSGQADLADTLQIQNALALRADQLRTDKLELTHDQFVLNRLLNRPHDSPWPSLQLPPVAPPVPYSAKLLALALAHEPNLKVMDQEVEQAKANVERTQRARRPEVSVGIQGYQYSGGAGDAGFREGVFTLNFSLPWANVGKYRKDYDREKKNEQSAEREREDQTLTVREELHHLTVDLDARRRQALLYKDEISIRAAQALSDRLTV